MSDYKPVYQINPETVEEISNLIEKENNYRIRQILSLMHAADIADILGLLKKKYRSYLFELLDSEVASEVMIDLDQSSLEFILHSIDENRISEIVDEMESDDATDIISELSDDVAEKVLESIDEEDSLEVKELLQYKEDSAGGIMQLEYISIMEHRTISEATQKIRRLADEVEDIYYIYVTDRYGVLIGSLTLKDIIIANLQMLVSDVMNKDIISVPVDVDQEDVARLFEKYDLISLPVVTKNNNLIGVITVDDIVDVIEKEAGEDISRMAGITEEEEIFEESTLRITRARLPWLITGLLGGIFSAFVLSHFETSINKVITLAFFVPVMTAMGGNIGMQSSTVVVRGLATGDLDLSQTWKQLFKEVRVAFLNGVLCAIILSCFAGWWLNQLDFALLLGVSLLLVIMLAGIVGSTVPLLLERANIDPAIATGPFVTTSNDILGLFIYLGLATQFLTEI